jgi:hypothetical protein
MARCCLAVGVVRISKVGASAAARGVRQVLRTKVARSAIKVEKLCTGVPSSKGLAWETFGQRRLRSASPAPPGRGLPWPPDRYRRTSVRARPRACATRRSTRACTGRCAHAPDPRGDDELGRTFRVDRLEGAESTFNVGQRLIVAHTVSPGASHVRCGERRANDVKAIQRRFGSDTLRLAREGEALVSSITQVEVLGDLVLIDRLCPRTRQSCILAGELASGHSVTLIVSSLCSVARQQGLALVRAQLGQLRVAAGH